MTTTDRQIIEKIIQTSDRWRSFEFSENDLLQFGLDKELIKKVFADIDEIINFSVDCCDKCRSNQTSSFEVFRSVIINKYTFDIETYKRLYDLGMFRTR